VTRPNEGYFGHVDAVIERANKLGIVMTVLPVWGDKLPVPYWGSGPHGLVNGSNARGYGNYLGQRLGHRDIVWVLGGDRPFNGNETVYRELVAGIKEGDDGRNLMTYHPMGSYSSSFFVHDEPWLDFNMFQSGHEAFEENWRFAEADYHRHPTKPVLDGDRAMRIIPPASGQKHSTSAITFNPHRPGMDLRVGNISWHITRKKSWPAISSRWIRCG